MLNFQSMLRLNGIPSHWFFSAFLHFVLFFFFMSRCVLYAMVIFFVFTGIAACNQANSLVSEVISPFHYGFFIRFLNAATSNVESST